MNSSLYFPIEMVEKFYTGKRQINPVSKKDNPPLKPDNHVK